MLGKPRISLNNLKTSPRLPCLGLNPIIECINRSNALIIALNILYTGGIFHCYMLDPSIYHFRGVESMLSLLSVFDGMLVSKQ